MFCSLSRCVFLSPFVAFTYLPDLIANKNPSMTRFSIDNFIPVMDLWNNWRRKKEVKYFLALLLVPSYCSLLIGVGVEVFFPIFNIFGVVPISPPKQLRHFIHGLFSFSSSQINFTFSWKLSFSNFWWESSDECRSIFCRNIFEERVLFEFNNLKKQLPSVSSSVKLYICSECSGIFYGWLHRRDSRQKVILCSSGLLLKCFVV